MRRKPLRELWEEGGGLLGNQDDEKREANQQPFASMCGRGCIPEN